MDQQMAEEEWQSTDRQSSDGSIGGGRMTLGGPNVCNGGYNGGYHKIFAVPSSDNIHMEHTAFPKPSIAVKPAEGLQCPHFGIPIINQIKRFHRGDE